MNDENKTPLGTGAPSEGDTEGNKRTIELRVPPVSAQNDPEGSENISERDTRQMSIADIQKEKEKLEKEKAAEEKKKKKGKRKAPGEVRLISIQRKEEDIADVEFGGPSGDIEVGLVAIVDGRVESVSHNGWAKEKRKMEIIDPTEFGGELKYKRAKKEGAFRGRIIHEARMPFDEYDFLRRIVLEREKITSINDIVTNFITNSQYFNALKATNPKFQASLHDLARRFDGINFNLETELNFPEQETEDIVRAYSSGNYSTAIYLECLKIAGGLEGGRITLEEIKEALDKDIQEGRISLDDAQKGEELKSAVRRRVMQAYGVKAENSYLFEVEYEGKKFPITVPLIDKKKKKAQAPEEREATEKELKTRDAKARKWENQINDMRQKFRKKGFTTQRIKAEDLIEVREQKTEEEQTRKWRLEHEKEQIDIYPVPEIDTIPEESDPDRVKIVTLQRGKDGVDALSIWEGNVLRVFSERQKIGEIKPVWPSVVGSSLSLLYTPSSNGNGNGKADGHKNENKAIEISGPVKSVEFMPFEDYVALEKAIVKREILQGVEECYSFYNQIIDDISKDKVERVVGIDGYLEEGKIRMREVRAHIQHPVRRYRTSIGNVVRKESLDDLAEVEVTKQEQKRAEYLIRKHKNMEGLQALVKSLSAEGRRIGYNIFLEYLSKYEFALRNPLGKCLEGIKSKSHKVLFDRIVSSITETEVECPDHLLLMSVALGETSSILTRVFDTLYHDYESPLKKAQDVGIEQSVSEENARGFMKRVKDAIVESGGATSDSAAGHATLGAVLLRQGKLDEAQAEYEEAIRLNKDDPVINQGMAHCYRERGVHTSNKSKRQEFFGRAVEHYITAKEMINDSIRRWTSLAKTKKAEAEIAKAEGKQEEIVKEFLDEASRYEARAMDKAEDLECINLYIKGGKVGNQTFGGVATHIDPKTEYKFSEYRTGIELGSFYSDKQEWEMAEWAYKNAEPLLEKSADNWAKLARTAEGLAEEAKNSGNEDAYARHSQEAEWQKKRATYENEKIDYVKGKLREARSKLAEKRRKKK